MMSMIETFAESADSGIGVGGWVGIVIGIGIFLFICGGLLAFFLTKRMFEKQIKENPPITEKMIRAMSVSYTHLTLPTIVRWCRSRWSPYH